jgi:hypothetical protein
MYEVNYNFLEKKIILTKWHNSESVPGLPGIIRECGVHTNNVYPSYYKVQRKLEIFIVLLCIKNKENIKVVK